MIGVVTVTYNSEDVLDDFLDSMAAQTADFRLFVVDNASADRSVERVSAVDDPRIRLLVQSENLGIAVGNNVGVRAALDEDCDEIVLLNNDTVFDATLLGDLSARAEESSADVVIPSLRYHEAPDRVWFEAATFARWRGSVPVATDPAPVPSVTEIECACTCCALFDRSVFDRVGLMDERYFVYWDDTDFFYRCHEAGLTMMLDSSLVVLHKVSTLTGGEDSAFSQTERIKNRVYFIRKHHSGPRRWVGLGATLVNVVRLVVTAPSRRHRLRSLLAAYRAGMRIPILPLA